MMSLGDVVAPRAIYSAFLLTFSVLHVGLVQYPTLSTSNNNLPFWFHAIKRLFCALWSFRKLSVGFNIMRKAQPVEPAEETVPQSIWSEWHFED